MGNTSSSADPYAPLKNTDEEDAQKIDQAMKDQNYAFLYDQYYNNLTLSATNKQKAQSALLSTGGRQYADIIEAYLSKNRSSLQYYKDNASTAQLKGMASQYLNEIGAAPPTIAAGTGTDIYTPLTQQDLTAAEQYHEASGTAANQGVGGQAVYTTTTTATANPLQNAGSADPFAPLPDTQDADAKRIDEELAKQNYEWLYTQWKTNFIYSDANKKKLSDIFASGIGRQFADIVEAFAAKNRSSLTFYKDNAILAAHRALAKVYLDQLGLEPKTASEDTRGSGTTSGRDQGTSSTTTTAAAPPTTTTTAPAAQTSTVVSTVAPITSAAPIRSPLEKYYAATGGGSFGGVSGPIGAAKKKKKDEEEEKPSVVKKKKDEVWLSDSTWRTLKSLTWNVAKYTGQFLAPAVIARLAYAYGTLQPEGTPLREAADIFSDVFSGSPMDQKKTETYKKYAKAGMDFVEFAKDYAKGAGPMFQDALQNYSDYAEQAPYQFFKPFVFLTEDDAKHRKEVLDLIPPGDIHMPAQSTPSSARSRRSRYGSYTSPSTAQYAAQGGVDPTKVTQALHVLINQTRKPRQTVSPGSSTSSLNSPFYWKTPTGESDISMAGSSRSSASSLVKGMAGLGHELKKPRQAISPTSSTSSDKPFYWGTPSGSSTSSMAGSKRSSQSSIVEALADLGKPKYAAKGGKKQKIRK